MIFDLKNRSERNRLIEYVTTLKDKSVEIIICDNKRTDRQNRSLHLWFDLVSKAFNDAGIDMRKFIDDGIDIPFTSETVKSHLWKPVMKGYLDKKSTTEMVTSDVPKIFDILNKHIGERTGIHIPFPNYDYLIRSRT